MGAGRIVPFESVPMARLPCDNLVGRPMAENMTVLDSDVDRVRARAEERVREAVAICAAEPLASFDNVWHTLILLELTPLERLNRSLLRGRGMAAHRARRHQRDV